MFRIFVIIVISKISITFQIGSPKTLNRVSNDLSLKKTNKKDFVAFQPRTIKNQIEICYKQYKDKQLRFQVYVGFIYIYVINVYL